MAPSSITAAGLTWKRSVRYARPWWSLAAELRRRRVSAEYPTAPTCFGRLPANEEMVVKGLSASLPYAFTPGDSCW